MKFLVDAQLPPALSQWLIDAGHESQHIFEVGPRDAPDGEIWDYAIRNAVIIVTKDEDFAARSSRDVTAPVIIWLRVGNTTNNALRAWIAPRLAGIVQLVASGSKLIEVI